MIFNSIRWRLQLWHGLILVAVLAAFGLTAYQVTLDNQLRRIDQELAEQLGAAFRPSPPPQPSPNPLPDRPPPDGKVFGGPPPRRGSPEMRSGMREPIQKIAAFVESQTNAHYFVFWLPDGAVGARSPGAPTDVPKPERAASERPDAQQSRDGIADLSQPGPGGSSPMRAVARSRGQMRELYRFMPFGDCLLVGRTIEPELAAMRQLAFGLWLAGGAVLALGLMGGWWVATRAMRPIADISTTAGKIARGDLAQRINVANTESELGHLAGVLNSTFARLEAAFMNQARFTSDAAHELRTPISVILSQTQTALARERPGSEYREALQACQRAAQRMRQLTESLLELARLDSGQEPMKRERFDLSRVARESVELVCPLAAERGVQLQCDLPIVECLGDAGRIGQVVTNLLTNAIQFNRNAGQVHVSLRAENGAAVLTVADTGEGIPAEDLPHIFERFYRVDKSRSRAQGQTGLGLAISKAIVDAHGGTIEISSQPGSGTTAIVRLPA